MTIKNQFKTAILLALLTSLLFWVGSYFGKTGLIFAGIFVVLMNFGSYFFSDKIVLWMYRAKEAKQSEHPKLHKVVKEVVKLSNLPMPKVYIIPTNSPNAFATGRSPKHAAVAATEGILKILDEEELKGVISHEFAHIKNYDIRLMTLVIVLVGIIAIISDWFLHISIFGGTIRSQPFAWQVCFIVFPSPALCRWAFVAPAAKQLRGLTTDAMDVPVA